jgi:hypothetical protein
MHAAGRWARRAFPGVVALTVSLGGAIGFAPTAGATPSWKAMPSANPAGPAIGVFTGVACVTATNCFAVGFSPNGPGSSTLVEQWNGAAWTLLASSNAPGAAQSRLAGVACVNASLCFAVGSAVTGGSFKTLIERWNGSSWAVVASPNPAGAHFPDLNGVACASATSCFAVGSTGTSPERTLVEHWNGAAWSISASANPSGSAQSYLTGVSCPSASSCFASGSSDTSPATTLIEHWNGSAWSIVASPEPAGVESVFLGGVACPSTASCFAVGYSQTASTVQTLVERWNGAAWTIVASVNPVGGQTNELVGVACGGASSCFAVGSTDGATMIQRFGGTSWTVSGTAKAGDLRGVACASAPSCEAVGAAATGTVPGLIDRWNGSGWAVAGHPSPTATDATLTAVACPGATTCFGVGHFTTTRHTTATLVERSNGTNWVIAASPNPAGVASELSAVSCVSATDCFAVGSTHTSAGPRRTLVEHWNGTAWSIVASPNHPNGSQGNLGNALRGVACVSATNCFAVGAWIGQVPFTLVEHWNGTTWTIVSSPNQSLTGDNALNGVSCASVTVCFAVGRWQDASLSSSKTLIERWNGTAWSIVTSPSPGASDAFDELSGVSCGSATSCFAVGETDIPNQTHTLIERWNGSAWTAVASPNRAGVTHSLLTGVACVSATACVGVGGSYTDPNAATALIVRLAGGTFSIQPSATPFGASRTVLAGVDCVSTTNCTAVGEFAANSNPFTLVEHYS